MPNLKSANQTSSSPLGGTPNFRQMFGGNNDAQLMRQRIQNALGNILTEEQMQKYQAMGSGQGVRPGTVWVLGKDGKPEQKNVRIRLASDSHTEIVSGLAEGEAVIVRSRTEQG